MDIKVRETAGMALRRASAIGTAVLLLAATPAAGQRQSLVMLDRIQTGQWELVARDGSRARERICLRDGRRLIQLRHPASTCERLVVEDSATEVTVQYTCRGQGFGRTSIRMENSRLIQVETQGIAGGLPFELSAEGRYVGACAD
jgi:hypothetical protein